MRMLTYNIFIIDSPNPRTRMIWTIEKLIRRTDGTTFKRTVLPMELSCDIS